MKIYVIFAIIGPGIIIKNVFFSYFLSHPLYFLGSYIVEAGLKITKNPRRMTLTSDPPASTSLVMELQVYAVVPRFCCAGDQTKDLCIVDKLSTN